MKRSALTFWTGVLAVAIGAGIARADGPQGPAPPINSGGPGVLAPSGQVRYVAIPAERGTVVEAVRTRGGRVANWTVIPGAYGNPLVGWDGTAGGLSADGTTLVLAAYPNGQATRSRFAVLTTKTLSRRAVVLLPGIWAFDALSPDASTMFLIQYRTNAPNSAYSVRAFDLTSMQLFPGAIVDRREDEAAMRGSPVTRKTSSDGRWAYTLYARARDVPFVHALDTVKREAYCIDLPLRLSQPKQMALRLRVRAGVLEVRSRRATIAAVDTKTLELRR